MTKMIDSTCRICFSEKQSYFPLFEIGDTKKYSELIKEYTGLEIIENDTFPKCICDECISELNTVIKFIDKCRISIEKFPGFIFLTEPDFYVRTELIKEELKDDDIKEEFDNFKNDYDVLPNHYENDYEDAGSDFFSPKQKTRRKKYKRFSKRGLESNVHSKFKLKKTKSALKNRRTIKIDKIEDEDSKFEISMQNNRLSDNDETEVANNEKSKFKLKRNQIKNDKVVCDECGQVCASHSALIIHVRKHTGEKPFCCPSCQKAFTQKGTLSEHVRRRHMKGTPVKRSFICDVCGKLFVKKCDLVTHMRIHTKDKPFKCSYCSNSFAQIGTQKQHERIHTGERPHTCHLCGKGFITKTVLRRHMSIHSDERNFKCDLCSKMLKSKPGLKHHLRFIHMADKPFVCDRCNQGFIKKCLLKSHLMAKHSERSGKCSLCNREFTNLEEHMRVHNNERPFECEICRKKFTVQRSLTKHMIIHDNPNKFSCTYDNCTVGYTMKTLLDFHILKVHTKEFTHVCKLCSKGYYRGSDLTRHIKLGYCKVIKIDSLHSLKP